MMVITVTSSEERQIPTLGRAKGYGWTAATVQIGGPNWEQDFKTISRYSYDRCYSGQLTLDLGQA